VPVDKLKNNPKCGNCKTFLEIPQRPIDVTEANFNQEVSACPGVVLVEFWSPQCSHCTKMSPVVDELAREKAGILKVTKVNIDQEQSLVARFGIRGTPTFMLYRNGKKLTEISGDMSKTELEFWIDYSLKS